MNAVNAEAGGADDPPVAGGCHCGAVRFEVDLDRAQDLDGEGRLRLTECNCSICSATGFLHWIVPASRFRLLAGEQALTEYRFGTGAARHLFCSRCGVKSFYVPRSHPDGFSVNARCVSLEDHPSIHELVAEPFDGRQWEENIAALHEKERWR